MAWAGGYVGDGVSTTNLAGRTLRDLILDSRRSSRACRGSTTAPSPGSPSRCAGSGVNAALKAMGSADDVETRTGRPSKRATYVKKLIGA